MNKLLIVLLLASPTLAHIPPAHESRHKTHKDSSVRRIGYDHVVKPVGHAGHWMWKKVVG